MTEVAVAGTWTSISAQGFAVGRYGAAATAAEYGMRTRERTVFAIQMLAAGLVLGPQTVPDAIGRADQLLSATNG